MTKNKANYKETTGVFCSRYGKRILILCQKLVSIYVKKLKNI